MPCVAVEGSEVLRADLKTWYDGTYLSESQEIARVRNNDQSDGYKHEVRYPMTLASVQVPTRRSRYLVFYKISL